MKHLLFTVTNELNYDQRMIRICSSLSMNGYLVTLIGRENNNSPKLTQQTFQQKRLFCFFNKGKWFYIEYKIFLFSKGVQREFQYRKNGSLWAANFFLKVL